MQYSQIKENVKTYKTPIIILAIIGVASIFAFFIIPNFILNVFVGLFLIFAGLYVYRKKKSISLLFILTLIGTCNILIFFTMNLSVTGTYYTGQMAGGQQGMTYEGQVTSEKTSIPKGETWYHDESYAEQYGDFNDTFRLPIQGHIYHDVPQRPTNLKYEIQYLSSTGFEGNQVEMKVWGTNAYVEEEDFINETKTALVKVPKPIKRNLSIEEDPDYTSILTKSITLSKSHPETTQLWSYGGDTTIDGSEPYEFYLFAFYGHITDEVTTDLNETMVSSLVEITPNVNLSDSRWGISETYRPNAGEVVEENTIIEFEIAAMLMLISFFIMFLIMFALGRVDDMIYFLIFETILSVLLLLVLMANAENLPVISDLIDATEAMEWADITKWDWEFWKNKKTETMGFSDYLIDFLLIIGQVVAVIIWVKQIGYILALCWGTYIVFKTHLESYADEFYRATEIIYG